jgi:hypothetical protein
MIKEKNKNKNKNKNKTKQKQNKTTKQQKQKRDKTNWFYPAERNHQLFPPPSDPFGALRSPPPVRIKGSPLSLPSVGGGGRSHYSILINKS